MLTEDCTAHQYAASDSRDVWISNVQRKVLLHRLRPDGLRLEVSDAGGTRVATTQDKQVFVYRLVSEDTIEEKVVALQQRKRDLFGRVVDDDAGIPRAIGADDVRALLGLAD